MRVRWLLALLGVTLVCAAPALAGSNLRGEVYAMRIRVDRASGIDPERKSFLEQRLYDDDTLLDPIVRPEWLSPAEFEQYNNLVLAIDRQLVESVFHPKPLAELRGDAAFWVRSEADGAWQAVALHVPSSYDPAHATTLILYLHGKGEAENRAIARPLTRELADRCGCIVAAPYARGTSQYADPAPADIYALREQLMRAFHIDPARVYLVGYSMGGFGVFEVGRYHADRWTAYLAIAGGLTGDDRLDVMKTFPGKRVYVVSGTRDDDIPNAHVRKSVEDLRAHGIETKYYEVPGGTHNLYTLRDAIKQAWNDMLAGARGSLEPLGGTGAAPAMPPGVTRPSGGTTPKS